MTGKKQEHNKGDSNGGSSHVDLIPMDLTIEILTRLPAKSLSKFQYVSRTWFSIIRSKHFIKSWSSMSSSPSSQLLLSFKNGDKFTHENPKKRLFLFTSSQEDEKSSSLVAKLNMTMTSTDAYVYTRCVSVNGFICLKHKGQTMICNPSTRQVITLPKITDTKWKSTFEYLGYDPVDDQYKVLLCTTSLNPKDDQDYMVLTLGGDHEKLSWRFIKSTTKNYNRFWYNKDYINPRTKETCINGFVYYGAVTSSLSTLIVCFDVRSERLSYIKAPLLSIVNGFRSPSTLISYKGKLASLNLCLRNEGYFEFWILQDAKEHKWSRKTFMFDTLFQGNHVWLDSFTTVPLSVQGTNKRGEIVISPKFLPRDEIFFVYYYDVVKSNIRRVKIEGVADDEEFRSRYGIGEPGESEVYISPDYRDNIAFL